MSLFDDLKKSSATELIVGLALFLATVAPGTLILLLYKPALLEKLDAFKILVVSLGFTAPILIWNIFSLRRAYKAADKSLEFFLGVAAAYSCTILYVSLLIAYLASLSFRQFLLVVLVLEVLHLISIGAKTLNIPKDSSEETEA